MKRALLLAAGVAAFVLTDGLVHFSAMIPLREPEVEGRTDAIVVLTGGTFRLATGFRLLGAGRAELLFVSGVGGDVAGRELARGSGLPEELVACCVTAGHGAGDTIGNAAETAVWVQAHEVASIRLVTAAYHMPRSLLEFRLAMPKIQIEPHPVFPPAFQRERWWRHPGSAGLVVGEYLKFLVARLRISLAGLFRPAVPLAATS